MGLEPATARVGQPRPLAPTREQSAASRVDAVGMLARGNVNTTPVAGTFVFEAAIQTEAPGKANRRFAPTRPARGNLRWEAKDWGAAARTPRCAVVGPSHRCEQT
jgi:hypothetical protein